MSSEILVPLIEIFVLAIGLFLSGVLIDFLLGFIFGENKKRIAQDNIDILFLGTWFVGGYAFLLGVLGLFNTMLLWAGLALFSILGLASLRKLNIGYKIQFKINGWGVVSFAVFLFFIFRNFYPLINVDSHHTYMAVVKEWLKTGSAYSSFIGWDLRYYIPVQTALFYGFDIQFLSDNTLFASCVQLLFRVLAVLTVWRWVQKEFGGVWALLFALLVLTDEHFFVSGVNKFVIVDGLMVWTIGYIVIRLVECKKENSSRALLILLALSFLPAIKYQGILYMLGLGGMIVIFNLKNFLVYGKSLILHQRLLLGGICLLAASGWYVRNYFLTGAPFFPIMASLFGSPYGDAVRESLRRSVYPGIEPLALIKYFSTFFVFQGIIPLKLALLALLALPFQVATPLWEKFTWKREYLYFICVTMVLICATTVYGYWSARYYRFGIVIYPIVIILFLKYFLQFVPSKIGELIGLVIVLCLVWGKINALWFGHFLSSPTIRENIDFIQGKTSVQEILKKHYPAEMSKYVQKLILNPPENMAIDAHVNWSTYLAPVNLKSTFIVSGFLPANAYRDEESLLYALQAKGIHQVLLTNPRSVELVSVENFAKNHVVEFYPKKIKYSGMGLPLELEFTKYH